jgi:hypothetical protein
LLVALFEEGSGFVGSGSFPCKKLSILFRKSCSSTYEGGGSSVGGTGHGTAFGGGPGRTVPQAVSKSDSPSIKITDFTVFFLP